MPAHEMDVVYQWIQATLAGDSTLQSSAPGGVWRAEAPDGTASPYVAITYLSQQSRDEMAFGGVRVYSDLYFDVVAAGPASMLSGVASAAARIDTLLTVAQQTAITGGTVLASYRAQPSESDPLIDGERWNYTGGVYRVMVKAS